MDIDQAYHPTTPATPNPRDPHTRAQERCAYAPPDLHGTEPMATERLDLRPFKMRDAEALQQWSMDPEWQRFFQARGYGSVEEAADAIASWRQQYSDPTFLCWCAQEASSSCAIGKVSASIDQNLAAAELEYSISPSHRGKGYAQEAVSAVMAHLHRAGIHRIIAKVSVDNIASQRTAESVGMELEGIMRDALKDRAGRFYDVAVYAHIG